MHLQNSEIKVNCEYGLDILNFFNESYWD